MRGRGPSARSPCKFNNVLKPRSHININGFPTLRLQLSGDSFPKSFRELFDILSQQLIGKSDSETRKKERKERAGRDQERKAWRQRRALGWAGLGGAGRTGSPWHRQLLGHMQHHARPFLKSLLFERIRHSQLEEAGPGPHLPSAEFASINPSGRGPDRLPSPVESPRKAG